MRRSVLVVPVLVAVAVGLAGCSDKTAGSATPGDETTESTTGDRPTLPGSGTSEPGEETSSTEPGSGDSALAEIQPCDLVSDDGAAQLGLTDEREEQVGEARACLWHYEAASESFTVTVGIFEERGLEDVVASDATPVPTIGSHEAVTYTSATGGCSVGIGVTDTSRVDVSAVGDEGPKCGELAMDVAKLVEPELP